MEKKEDLDEPGTYSGVLKKLYAGSEVYVADDQFMVIKNIPQKKNYSDKERYFSVHRVGIRRIFYILEFNPSYNLTKIGCVVPCLDFIPNKEPKRCLHNNILRTNPVISFFKYNLKVVVKF
jgi:hypothetical protein